MLQTETENTPTLQADIMALDALFKRIAERGRKIRAINNTTNGDNPGVETISARQDPNPQGKEYKP